jgi:hypothetical protein
MGAAHTFTAGYGTQYKLSLATDPAAVGTSNLTGLATGGWYDSGDTATITAAADVANGSGSRYDFGNWTGDVSSPPNTSNPVSVTMNRARSITANYQLQYSVTFDATGLGGADVTQSATVVTVGASDTISVAALPAVRWVNDGGSISYSYSATVSSSTAGKEYDKTSGPTPASPISNIASPQSVTAAYGDRYPTTITNVAVSPKSGSGNLSPQYSDTVTLSATLNASNTSSGPANGTVIFKLNGKPTAGVSTTLSSTVWSSSGTINVSADLRLLATGTNQVIPAGAGSYAITAQFVPASSSLYLGSSGTTAPSNPAISKEDMALGYTGLPFVNTSKAGGTLTLSAGATVTENPNELGDKAWNTINSPNGLQVKFTLLNASMSPLQTCTASVTQTSGQVSSGTGSVGCSFSTAVKADSYVVQAELVTNAYYTAEVLDTSVDVADPGTGFITGGGWVPLTGGDKGNFGFNAKFLKSGNLQGNSLFIYRTTANLGPSGLNVTGAPDGVRPYNYIIKANALTGLRTCGVANQIPCQAQLTGKSNITAVDRLTGIAYAIDASVIGNQQYFEMDVVDNGEPGSKTSTTLGPDIYALKVYTSSGTFLTVGGPWNPMPVVGTSTLPNPTNTALGGGNIQVRP